MARINALFKCIVIEIACVCVSLIHVSVCFYTVHCYVVHAPCKDCLSSTNNGHFWMFHADAVEATVKEHHEKNGLKPYVWSAPSPIIGESLMPVQR